MTELQVQGLVSGSLFGVLCISMAGLTSFMGGMRQVQQYVFNTSTEQGHIFLADLLDVMKHKVSLTYNECSNTCSPMCTALIENVKKKK